MEHPFDNEAFSVSVTGGSSHGSECACCSMDQVQILTEVFRERMRSLEDRNTPVTFPVHTWEGSQSSFDQLAALFAKNNLPELSLEDEDGRCCLNYTYKDVQHCPVASMISNQLFPGCGAALLGPPGGRQPYNTRESLNLWTTVRYIASGELEFTKNQWKLTIEDKIGRYDYDLTHFEKTGHQLRESLEAYLQRMLGALAAGKPPAPAKEIILLDGPGGESVMSV